MKGGTETNMREVNSYKSLFKIQFRIYEIGNKTLPFPIPLDTLIVTVILIPFMYPIAYLLDQQFTLFLAIFLAGGASYLISQLDLQGKSMFMFLFGLIEYFARKKTINLTGKKIQVKNRHYTNWEMGDIGE